MRDKRTPKDVCGEARSSRDQLIIINIFISILFISIKDRIFLCEIKN